MKVSIVIPTYKDLEALGLILEALEYQTYKNFEVVIAEDDNSLELKVFLKTYKSINKIIHISHNDNGNRKATILNKALLDINGEYIIFIDGDTIPFSTFVESHVQLSEKKTILCGRRVNLGNKVSADLRSKSVKAFDLEKRFFSSYNYLKNDNLRHYEQGLRLNIGTFLYKNLMKLNKNIHILGSNFSCYKSDLYDINGFDEDIVGGSKDDVDLEWRFLYSGCQLKSCKYYANLFHLNHSRSNREEEEKTAKLQMLENQKNNMYIAENGIIKK